MLSDTLQIIEICSVSTNIKLIFIKMKKIKVNKMNIFFYVLLGLITGAMIYTVQTNTKLREENLSLTQQNQEYSGIITKQYTIDTCLETAYTNYKNEWTGFCKSNNIPLVDGSCSLPVQYSVEFDSAYRTEKNMCIERYK